MTDGQLREIAADRLPRWRGWDNKQMDRLKAKYISRPGKPAARYELLRRVDPGAPPKGSVPGTPSMYETTGIEPLLKPDTSDPAGRSAG